MELWTDTWDPSSVPGRDVLRSVLASTRLQSQTREKCRHCSAYSLEMVGWLEGQRWWLADTQNELDAITEVASTRIMERRVSVSVLFHEITLYVRESTQSNVARADTERR